MGHGHEESGPYTVVEVAEKKGATIFGNLFSIIIMLPALAVAFIKESTIAKTHEANAEGGGGGGHH